jgi:hypothetical protein
MSTPHILLRFLVLRHSGDSAVTYLYQLQVFVTTNNISELITTGLSRRMIRPDLCALFVQNK